MKNTPLILILAIVASVSCTQSGVDLHPSADGIAPADTLAVELPAIDSVMPSDIVLTKQIAFEDYTLDDVYPWRDTVRSFKWEVIKTRLAAVENAQLTDKRWGVLQNYKNRNRTAPLVRTWTRNNYGNITDSLGVERYQSVPLYAPGDTLQPSLYGRDGTLVEVLSDDSTSVVVNDVFRGGTWTVPRRYVAMLADTVAFHHVIVVDRRDQNIATLTRTARASWSVLSMNPATTGMRNPPYAKATPLGYFVLQQKKERMIYLADGSSAYGGFAPYASRFTNGAYIHGVPVNAPGTEIIEWSWSLGTTPRSHMCVRNATSHARFIYDTMPLLATLVVVIE